MRDFSKESAPGLNNPMSSKEYDDEDSKIVGYFIIFLLFSIIFGSIAVQISPLLPASIRQIVKLGQVGDFFGGLSNPLIALLALAALKKSIKLQKKELEETRQAFDQQRREQRFFDLLKIYNQATTTIEFEGSDGKIAFRKWFNHPSESSSPSRNLIIKFLRVGFDPYSIDAKNAWDLLRENTSNRLTEYKVQQAWNTETLIFDHYFRTIFVILRDSHRLLGESEHFYYVKLFRAQLSRDELILIALNSIFNLEGHKMRPYIVRYGLLKHLPKGKLRDHAEKILPPESFGLSWIRAQHR